MAQIILSIRLESDKATAMLFDIEMKSSRLRKRDIELPPCDTHDAVKKQSGSEVLLLLGKYINQLQQRCKIDNFLTALSLPGTIDSDSGVIVRSTRLGIYEPFSMTKKLAESFRYQLHIFNDTKSMAIGEMRHGIGTELLECKDFAFLLVGEGVGSAIFIDRHQYIGAGAGGHLGRLIISPTGPYSEAFRCRGPLEVFTSREAISRHIIAEYRDIAEKDHISLPAAVVQSRIKQLALLASDHSAISVDDLARAINERDEIAISAVDEAAQYLGLAISNLITIMNPPLVILGGEMIDKMPYYFEKAFTATKRYSWTVAWERTRLVRAKLGSDAQLWGGAELSLDKTQNRSLRKEARHI